MAKKAAATAYDDEDLTDDEKKLIEEADVSAELPPPDSEEGGDTDTPPADEAKPAGEKPAEAPADAAPADKPADQQQQQQQAPVDDNAEFAAFLEKNKDKSPEELARIAFQQSKRASKEAAGSRIANQRIEALSDRAKRVLERRTKMLEQAPDAKKTFRDRLKEDPDAATAELYDRLVDQEISEVDAAADKALFEEAVGFAQTYVPGFEDRWPAMRALGREIGFSDDEINGVRDGRDLVVLSLAQVAADLMKGGFIDPTGRPTGLIPQPAKEATDPRLTGPEPIKTIGSGGARATDGTPSTEQALENLLSMNDAEFAKLDPAELENILRAAG